MRSWPPRLQQWRVQLYEVAQARTMPEELVACGAPTVKPLLAPELLAAIMDRESLGGMALKPRGPKGKGDFVNGVGRGHGLMQIDDRAWPAFCADPKLWQDPLLNIFMGAGVLSIGLQRFKDDVPAALAAYNAGTYKVSRVLLAHGTASISQLDALTTDKNYVSDCLARIHRLQFGGEA